MVLGTTDMFNISIQNHGRVRGGGLSKSEWTVELRLQQRTDSLCCMEKKIVFHGSRTAQKTRIHFDRDCSSNSSLGRDISFMRRLMMTH